MKPASELIEENMKHFDLDTTEKLVAKLREICANGNATHGLSVTWFVERAADKIEEQARELAHLQAIIEVLEGEARLLETDYPFEM